MWEADLLGIVLPVQIVREVLMAGRESKLSIAIFEDDVVGDGIALRKSDPSVGVFDERCFAWLVARNALQRLGSHDRVAHMLDELVFEAELFKKPEDPLRLRDS